MNRLRPTRKLTQLPFQGSSGYFSSGSSGTFDILKTPDYPSSSSSSGSPISPISNTFSYILEPPYFRLGQSQMVWDYVRSAPSSPILGYSAGENTLHKFYHPFAFPSESFLEKINKKPEKCIPQMQTSKLPMRASSFRQTKQESDDYVHREKQPTTFRHPFAPKNEPINSETFEVHPAALDSVKEQPSDFEITKPDDYCEFRPERSSTPHKSLPKIMRCKRKLELSNSNKENQPDKKCRKVAVAKRKSLPVDKLCEFCKESGEPSIIYTHHTLKDSKGRVLCPALRQLECPICKADGDLAHLAMDCPQKGSSPLKFIRRCLSFLHI